MTFVEIFCVISLGLSALWILALALHVPGCQGVVVLK